MLRFRASGSEGSSVRFRRNHHYCDWTVSISQNTCLSMSGMNILDMKVQPFNPVVGTGLVLYGKKRLSYFDVTGVFFYIVFALRRIWNGRSEAHKGALHRFA